MIVDISFEGNAFAGLTQRLWQMRNQLRTSLPTKAVLGVLERLPDEADQLHTLVLQSKSAHDQTGQTLDDVSATLMSAAMVLIHQIQDACVRVCLDARETDAILAEFDFRASQLIAAPANRSWTAISSAAAAAPASGTPPDTQHSAHTAISEAFSQLMPREDSGWSAGHVSPLGAAIGAVNGDADLHKLRLDDAAHDASRLMHASLITPPRGLEWPAFAVMDGHRASESAAVHGAGAPPAQDEIHGAATYAYGGMGAFGEQAYAAAAAVVAAAGHNGGMLLYHGAQNHLSPLPSHLHVDPQRPTSLLQHSHSHPHQHLHLHQQTMPHQLAQQMQAQRHPPHLQHVASSQASLAQGLQTPRGSKGGSVSSMSGSSSSTGDRTPRPSRKGTGVGPAHTNRRAKRPNHNATIIAVLDAWYAENRRYPYPSEEVKKTLLGQTSLSMMQLNNWFINKRRRDPAWRGRVATKGDVKDEC